MKKLTLIALSFFLSVLLYGQKKLSINFFFDNFYALTKNTTDRFSTFEYSEVSRTDNTITLEKRQFDFLLNASNTTQPGFSAGTKLQYQLNKCLALSAGIGLTSFRVERKNTLSNALAGTTQVTVNYMPPPGGGIVNLDLPKTGFEPIASYYFYVRSERFHFTAIKLPVGIQLTPANSKFSLVVEMIPVVIMKYEVTPAGVANPEGAAQQSATSANKWNLSGIIGCDYAITKSFSVNLFYQRYFNSPANGKINPGINFSNGGIALIYKMKALK